MQRLAQRLLIQQLKPSYAMTVALAQTRLSCWQAPMRMFSKVNAAVPAHEGEMKSFGEDYDEFMKQQ
jgi:hypothetical protein